MDEVVKTSAILYADRPRPTINNQDLKEFTIEFPIGKLLSIPLEDYMEIRTSKPFKRLRRALAKFRDTAHLQDGAKAQEAFEASGALLTDYVVSGNIAA